MSPGLETVDAGTALLLRTPRSLRSDERLSRLTRPPQGCCCRCHRGVTTLPLIKGFDSFWGAAEGEWEERRVGIVAICCSATKGRADG